MSLEQFGTNEKNEPDTLADSLEALESSQNDGRGVQCVKGIITYLRAGKIEEARRLAWHDYDKIRNYPDIQQLVDESLLKDWAPGQRE